MKFLLGDEIILKSVRRHWFFIAMPLVGYFIGALIPLFVFTILLGIADRAGSSIDPFVPYFPIILFGYAVWLLMLWMMAFVSWTNYYLDVWYITNLRVIDVVQNHLFQRDVTSVRLDMIQDASISTHGLLQVVLGVADIRIETAGEHGTFVIRDAYEAEDLKQFISQESRKAFEKYHAGPIASDSSANRPPLP